MPLRKPDLLAQAREFTGRLNSVLNSTITSGVRLSVVETRAGHALVGFGVTKSSLVANHFPLNKVAGRGPLRMTVSYHLCLDDSEGTYLQVLSSVIALSDSDDTELMHFDYEREKADGYPEAHLQVTATSGAWETVSPGRSLSRLHLPAGGRRFRFTLEDVASFLIREGMVSPSPSAASTIADHQARFDRDQLCAAIRRDPETARDFLDSLDRRRSEAAPN